MDTLTTQISQAELMCERRQLCKTQMITGLRLKNSLKLKGYLKEQSGRQSAKINMLSENAQNRIKY